MDIEERTVGILGLRGTRFEDLSQESDLARSAIVPGFAVAPTRVFDALDRFDWD